MFRCSERERGRERTALRRRYNTEERRVEPHKTQRHQPPETVPFIVYITTLFFFITLHLFYQFMGSSSNQFIATEALYTVCTKEKKIKKGRFFFFPGLQPSSTRFIPLGHNRTHLQLEAFSRAGWSDRHRGILCLLWPIKLFFCILIVFKYHFFSPKSQGSI